MGGEREGGKRGREGEMKVRGSVRREGEKWEEERMANILVSKCTVHVYMPLAHHG